MNVTNSHKQKLRVCLFLNKIGSMLFKLEIDILFLKFVRVLFFSLVLLTNCQSVLGVSVS